MNRRAFLRSLAYALVLGVSVPLGKGRAFELEEPERATWPGRLLSITATVHHPAGDVVAFEWSAGDPGPAPVMTWGGYTLSPTAQWVEDAHG